MAKMIRQGDEWLVQGERYHLTIRESVPAPIEKRGRFFITCWYGTPRFVGRADGYETLPEAWDVARAWVDERDEELEHSKFWDRLFQKASE